MQGYGFAIGIDIELRSEHSDVGREGVDGERACAVVAHFEEGLSSEIDLARVLAEHRRVTENRTGVHLDLRSVLQCQVNALTCRNFDSCQ